MDDERARELAESGINVSSGAGPAKTLIPTNNEAAPDYQFMLPLAGKLGWPLPELPAPPARS
jgi:hypothetical protein